MKQLKSFLRTNGKGILIGLVLGRVIGWALAARATPPDSSGSPSSTGLMV